MGGHTVSDAFVNSTSGFEVRSDAAHLEAISFWDDLFAFTMFLACVFVSGKIVHRLGGPSLIGEMLCGIVLGPTIANFAPEPRGLVLLGEFGLSLLMLEAGLEVDVSLLKQVGPRGLMVATIGAILPFGCGFGVGRALGFSFVGSFCAGAALQPTSLAIVLGVMKSGEVLNTPTGQLIVAAAAIDDVIAVILLSEVHAFQNPSALNFVIPVLSAFAFLIVVGALAVFVVPNLLSNFVLPRVPPQHREFLVLGLILATSIGLQTIAVLVKSSYLLGSLLAGLSFSTIRSAKDVWERQVKRLLHWLLKLFFAATIGFEIPAKAFWTRRTLSHGMAFIGPVLAKVLVGALAVPLTLSNAVTVGSAMCARGEFGFIIALQSFTLKFLTHDQYASLVFALLFASISMPFTLQGILSMTNKRGIAKFDEAEYNTAVDAVSAFNPVYYQMRLRCFNSWGLMNDVLTTATKVSLQVMDARIHADGNIADDVFYFKDLMVQAPIKAAAGDEAAMGALKEVQNRLDNLYEEFFAVAKAANMASAKAQDQPVTSNSRVSLDMLSRRLNEAQGREVQEVDLTLSRWMPGLIDSEQGSQRDSESTDRLMLGPTPHLGGQDSNSSEESSESCDRYLVSDSAQRHGSVGTSGRTSAQERSRIGASVSAIGDATTNSCSRQSIEMILTELKDTTGHDVGKSADRHLREGIVFNTARELEKLVRGNNKHAGFSRHNPQRCESTAEKSGGYSRRSLDYTGGKDP